MFTKPDPADLLSIHRRLLAGDPVAPAALAELVIDPLTKTIQFGRSEFRDQCMASEAVTDAVLDFAKSPAAFHPARSNVWSFLEMASRRNLANILLKERRQRARVSRFKDVALHDPARKKVEESPLAFLTEREASRLVRDKVNAEIAVLSPTEAAVFKLMSDGVRASVDYAKVLGITAKPLKARNLAVKQIKDRLLKRLKRAFREANDE